MRKPLIALVAITLVMPAMADVEFYATGTPGSGSYTWSDAYGVTNDGVVVGSMYDSTNGVRAFSWTYATGLVDIGSLGTDSQTYARAITPDGAVIIGESQNPNTSFRLISGETIEDLSYPQNGEYDQSALKDVSDNGLAAAGLLSRYADGCYRAALWQESDGWQDLGVLFANDYESSANAISADGTKVAGYSCGDRFAAFLWSETDGMVELSNPWGQYSAAAIAMSADGDYITGQATNPSGYSQAVLWDEEGTPLILDPLDGFEAAAGYGISGDGSLIGGTSESSDGEQRAVFWTSDGTVYDLETYLNEAGIDTTGWDLTAITEVSQNGTYLTGRGINADGYTESFLVRIPEPATLTLLIAGAMLLYRRG